jgi:hypothetical protein
MNIQKYIYECVNNLTSIHADVMCHVWIHHRRDHSVPVLLLVLEANNPPSHRGSRLLLLPELDIEPVQVSEDQQELIVMYTYVCIYAHHRVVNTYITVDLRGPYNHEGSKVRHKEILRGYIAHLHDERDRAQEAGNDQQRHVVLQIQEVQCNTLSKVLSDIIHRLVPWICSQLEPSPLQGFQIVEVVNGHRSQENYRCDQVQ